MRRLEATGDWLRVVLGVWGNVVLYLICVPFKNMRKSCPKFTLNLLQFHLYRGCSFRLTEQLGYVILDPLVSTSYIIRAKTV